MKYFWNILEIDILLSEIFLHLYIFVFIASLLIIAGIEINTRPNNSQKFQCSCSAQLINLNSYNQHLLFHSQDKKFRYGAER